MKTRTYIPANIKAAIFAQAFSGTPRKRVLEWVYDTATGKTNPISEGGLAIRQFGNASEANITAMLNYAGNLRPNRSPSAERTRKAKYTGPKVVGYAFQWDGTNELGTLTGEGGDEDVLLFDTPADVCIGQPGGRREPIPTHHGHIVALKRLPVSCRDFGAILRVMPTPTPATASATA